MIETWITVRTPNRRALTLLLDGALVVGRDCDGLSIPDQRVSRRHTGFEPLEGRVQVTDLGSRNGTEVNGTTIDAPVLVGDGDVVIIGNTKVTVHTRDRSDSAGGGFPQDVATELVTPASLSLKTSIDLVAEAVEEDVRANVVGVENEPGTLTVVFSDIVSSTELALSMGDASWMQALRAHHELVSAHVEAHQGRIVKNQGDGYMLCFRSARHAILACVGMQHDFKRLRSTGIEGADADQDADRDADDQDGGDGSGSGDPAGATDPGPGAELRVRMGAHTGEVMMQNDGDLFGKHVIVAARIGALAGADQILVSSLTKQIAEPRGDIAFGSPTEAKLKGIEGLTVVHDVNWPTYT